MESTEVLRISRLARIDLDQDEGARFADQLTKILAYFEKLQEVDTGGVSPASHPTDLVAPVRADRPDGWEAPRDLVARSDGHTDEFYRVPRVLE